MSGEALLLRASPAVCPLRQAAGLQMAAPCLPVEIWQAIALLALGSPPQGVDEDNFSRTQWSAWFLGLARLSAVNQALRMALLGPGAAALWTEAVFMARYPRWTRAQSQGLVRLLTAQAKHARTVFVQGGSWSARQLSQAVSSLRPQSLYLSKFRNRHEASILSKKLADTASSLAIATTQHVRLPSSVVELQLLDLSENNIAFICAHVGMLPHLPCLRELHLSLTRHTGTSFSYSLAVQYPLLQQFSLHLTSDALRQDLAGLQLPAGCSLELSLESCSATEGEDSSDLSAALRQLAGVQLLHLIVTTYSLSGEQERMLHACNISSSLSLELRHHRYHLRHHLRPAGAKVYHSSI